MIEIVRADQCDDKTIYSVFKEAYSDYIVNVIPPYRVFVDRFFGAEGNRRDLSFLAFEEGRPIGLVLSGLVNYGGKRMMRCGTLAVIPSARRRGIGDRLMEKHLEEGEARGVEGFFLEVIAGNERALHLYRNEGYEPVETILYVRGMPNLVRGDTLGVRFLERTEGESFLMSRVDGHLPWQCHPEYYREDPSAMYLGYRDGDELVGVLLGTEAGHIAALHVHPRFRGRGIGRRLVTTFWEKLNGEELRSAFFESSDLLRFFEGIGLKRTSLSQLHCVKK
jgi:ribosomal protein S18 acetylase RimI-like enzyme